MSIRESEARALASTSAPTPPESVHRRKIAKAPNPLSMKKKKSTSIGSNSAKERPKANNSPADSLKRRRDTDGALVRPQNGGNDSPEDKLDSSTNTGGGHKRKRRRKDNQA